MCVRMLRRDGKKIGIAANFAIMDDTDQRTIIRDILHDLDFDERQISPGAALDEISKAKNALWSPDAVRRASTRRSSASAYAQVYREYERRLRESNGLDFDDLISQDDRAARERTTNVRTRYQNKFRYILVDEYQDVNFAQYQLVRDPRGRAQEHHGRRRRRSVDLFVARQRLSRMILRFEEDFPGAKVFKLEENYRCTQTILDRRERTRRRTTRRAPRRRSSPSATRAKPSRRSGAETERAEARYVIEKIKELVREGAAYRDFLVLYRTNAQSRVFEEGFLAEGIPYRVVGGVGFYARTEIKDMIAYLRYIVNPSDAVAFRRIVNVPRRWIGQQTLASLVDAANAAGVSVGEAVFDKELLKRAVPKKQKELERFAELITICARTRGRSLDQRPARRRDGRVGLRSRTARRRHERRRARA